MRELMFVHGARPWQMRRGELTVKSVEEGGEAVPQRRWRRNSGGFFRRNGAPARCRRESSAVASCAKGCEEASVAGRKKDLPRSPIIGEAW